LIARAVRVEHVVEQSGFRRLRECRRTKREWAHSRDAPTYGGGPPASAALLV